MLPTCAAAVLAMFHLLNALSLLQSASDRGIAHSDAVEQDDLTRFAEKMETRDLRKLR